MAEEPDGSLIVENGGTLRRLDPTGHLDRSFGDGGKLTPPPAGGVSRSAEWRSTGGGGSWWPAPRPHHSPGSLGCVRLTPAGKLQDSGEQNTLGGRVFDTAASDGSLFLRMAPTKGKRVNRIRS